MRSYHLLELATPNTDGPRCAQGRPPPLRFGHRTLHAQVTVLCTGVWPWRVGEASHTVAKLNRQIPLQASARPVPPSWKVMSSPEMSLEPLLLDARTALRAPYHSRRNWLGSA
jgi:DNA-binding helix-hairpin-helix protein with protein kinase domain